MEIKSSFLGEQQVDPTTLITFPKGIPGFENQTKFKLFHQEQNPIIYWLQSIDDENLTFSVANPANFNINYSFVISDEEQALLKLENMDDLIILILLHAGADAQEAGKPAIRGSIKSPLLINSAERVAIQKNLSEIEQSITVFEKNEMADAAQI